MNKEELDIHTENAKLKRIIDPHLDADGNFDRQGFDWKCLEWEDENQRMKKALGEIAKADKKKIMSESWDFVMACVGDMIYIAEQALAAPPQKGQKNGLD